MGRFKIPKTFPTSLFFAINMILSGSIYLFLIQFFHQISIHIFFKRRTQLIPIFSCLILLTLLFQKTIYLLLFLIFLILSMFIHPLLFHALFQFQIKLNMTFQMSPFLSVLLFRIQCYLRLI